MATIYPTADYIYNVNATATIANSNSIVPYTQGVYTYGYATTSTSSIINTGSSMDTELIEALFTLKPKLRKKYKNDRAAFRRDVLAAAKAQEQVKAVEKLSDLLSIEA